MLARESAPEEVAVSLLSRLLARNKSFGCMGSEIGDLALHFKAVNRKSTPRWRGPAKGVDIDET